MDGSTKNTNRLKSRQSIAHIPSLSRTTDGNKQNATIDLSAAMHVQSSSTGPAKKRVRGKSLGPGGLEALKKVEENTTKVTSSYQPKSILKPTIPLTPPGNIPTFDELRQRTTQKKSPAKVSAEALLIDFSTPGPSRDGASFTSAAISQNLFDPFSPVKPSESTKSEQVNKAADLGEEQRARQEQRKAILEQRAARRKSMANRRVSFAPEATLHTWSVMELAEDSTTSSASNSTRRQSSITAQPTPQREGQSFVAEPTNPGAASPLPVHVEEPLVKASPIRQQALRQKKRVRGASISSDLDMSGDEAFSSSPSGDLATESSPIRIEDSIDSDSDTDGDIAMSMDDITQNTVNSQGSTSSSQSSLEERLRTAANQAGTRGIEYDEYGDDVSMEIANDTVTNAFQPWDRGPQSKADTEDQENINPFFPARKAQQIWTDAQNEDNPTQGMTMEMTKAVGGIIGSSTSPRKSRRKFTMPQRRINAGRRQSLAADSTYEDETMDFTTMAGGILSPDHRANQPDFGSDEDVTMEFTTAVGGVRSSGNKRESLLSTTSDGNETMDITAAVGGILAPIEEQTEPQTETEDDRTTAMEMTRAVGGILSNELNKSISYPQIAMEDSETLTGSKKGAAEADVSSELAENLEDGSPQQLKSSVSDTGSPTLALKPRGSARSRPARTSQISTPDRSNRSTPRKASSATKQSTPTKQITPLPSRAKTPERTPISNQAIHRGVSPVKLFQAEIAAKAATTSGTKSYGKQQDLLFAQDEITGRQTPRVVLHAPKPHQHLQRRSSGIGIDKEGLGSPSVTQLLSRRTSIGDAVPQFKLDPTLAPNIRLEDPKQMGEELDVERAEDERRESGRFVMEQEANEQQEENVTLQLKDMIRSMTPKKNSVSKLKGRKSLAIGSAKGLLGKRPMELDEEDEAGDMTPKRLKAVSREGSPVKSIYLPKPPTREETTGRLSKKIRKALDDPVGDQTPTLVHSPSKSSSAESPQQLSRYKDIQDPNTLQPTSFEERLDNVVSAVDPLIEHPLEKSVTDEDKISLQEFLNMTNIHFIELNTTKRRYTAALSAKSEPVNDQNRSSSTKSSFVAAATTLPLLELYQHATKELKSYISTGRKIIRSIEGETLSEQPALFREYVEARPDIKLVMDNQFRNGKTHARLQSKESWYSWRSQLVDGLRNGLEGIRVGMVNDSAMLKEQSEALAEVLPNLRDCRKRLTNDVETLQNSLDNIDSIDYDALKASRRELQTTDLELQQKLNMLQNLQQQIQEKHNTLSQAVEIKEEMQQQIAEANRIREEYRGWATKDVVELRSKVDTLQKESGWSLITAEEDLEGSDAFGVALTMSYKETLRLFFYPTIYDQAMNDTRHRSRPSSQSISGQSAPISLTYALKRRNDDVVYQLPTEQRFFLQLLQGHLHAISMLSGASASAATILNTVSSGWELACKISEEIRLLKLAGVTRVSIQSDEKLCVKISLLAPGENRIDIEFTLFIMLSNDGKFSISKSVDATAVYGPVTRMLDANKLRKVQTSLGKEIETRALGEGAWICAIQGYEGWYHNQQHKHQQQSIKQPSNVETEDIVEVQVAGSTTPKSPVPASSRTLSSKRSPLAMKKSNVIQKKIPVSTLRQDKFRISQREQTSDIEKPQVVAPISNKGKENVNPLTFADGPKGPAITPEMQEAMMQRTPVKRVGALRRSPV